MKSAPHGGLPARVRESRALELQKRHEARMSRRVGPISPSVPMQVAIPDVIAPPLLGLEAKARCGVAMSVRLAVAPPDGGVWLS